MLPDTLPLTPHDDDPARAATDAAPPEPTPLLIDIQVFAKLVSRSVPSLERDDAAGRIPAPLKIYHSKRWRLAEIEAWVAHGCPPRKEWRHIWEMLQRQR
jgi:hypothetical protein